MSTDDIRSVIARFDRIEATLQTLVERQAEPADMAAKGWTTTRPNARKGHDHN
jgi:hypothetical protein